MMAERNLIIKDCENKYPRVKTMRGFALNSLDENLIIAKFIICGHKNIYIIFGLDKQMRI